MWAFVGAAAGVALGVGFAGARGQHWAVRVICAAGFVVGAVGLLLVGLFGGKASPAWEVLGGAVLSFAVASIWMGASLLVALARARPARAAGAGVVVVALVAGLVGAGAASDGGGAGAVDGMVPGAAEVAQGVPLLGAAGAEAARMAQGAGPGGGASVSVQNQPVAQPGAVSVSSEKCLCSGGEFCTGPRGGRYCLRPDGSKKYRP